MFVLAALWWAATRGRARVLFTAPGNKQVQNVLWKELRRICYSKLPDGRRVWEFFGVEPAKLPSTGMQWPDGREILGYAADVPENMQGFSGPEVLALVDEGSGVPDDIFEAIDGNQAGKDCVLVAAGNPTRQSGWFFDAFHSKREFWDRHTISSEETPNVTGEELPIDGLADPAFIASRKKEYGETSAWVMVRIKGEFAGTAANAVVGLALVEAASDRWKSRPANDHIEASLELGVDVARFGDDDSVIAPRRGYRMYELESVHGFDTIQVAGKVVEVARRLRRGNEKVRVKIDANGVGSGVVDQLRQPTYKDLIDVVEVNSSEKADDEEKYFNLRTQLHFGVADWLKDGGELPPDPKLEAELLAPVYSFDNRSRQKVESKDDIKKRLKRSPDRADAVSLSVYKASRGFIGVGGGRGGSRVGTGRGY